MTAAQYGETWAAYKLASVIGALSATNDSAVVVIGGGHGHVNLTPWNLNFVPSTNRMHSAST